MLHLLPIQDGPARPGVDRFYAWLVLLVGLGFVVALARVDPDVRGHGTHEQLGMDACNWPKVYHIPCPTCGCTTAATHLVHLQPLQAFSTQPFGATLALLGILLAILALYCLCRRKAFLGTLVFLPYGTMMVSLLGLLLLSWLYTYLTFAP